MASEAPAGSESAQSSKDVSNRVGFLDLPRELRDLVYEFGLRAAGAIFIYSPDLYSYSSYKPTLKGKVVKYKDEGPLEPRPVGQALAIGLLRTCRQLHAESVEVLYRSNTFRLYTSQADFAPSYRFLIRHITFTMEAGQGIYHHDRDTVGYWWRRTFWPNILERSSNLLERYPQLESLTFPIKSNLLGQTYRPAFFAVQNKTREQRIALAAIWLNVNCPLADERLRQCLHLDIAPSVGFSKTDYEGSRFCPDEDEDEWDPSEFAEAFEKMKNREG